LAFHPGEMPPEGSEGKPGNPEPKP